MSRNKIDGWYRLWIVGTGFWLALWAVFAITSAPDFSSSHPRRAIFTDPNWGLPSSETAWERRKMEAKEKEAAEAAVSNHPERYCDLEEALAAFGEEGEADSFYIEMITTSRYYAVVRYAGQQFGIGMIPPLFVYVG